ncbi:sensor histidine kinase [Niameybacter sp.]|uniref:sensor histidine kinase n=1 Tax=Niameybacter sp. TaxID=2033640 RepID=UPI002FC7FA0B
MSFKSFIHAKLVTLVVYILLMLFTTSFFIAMHLSAYSILFFNMIFAIAYISLLFYEFYKKSSYYNRVLNELALLDQKYLLCEVLSEPDFLEGKILYNTLSETNKSMNDVIDYYQRLQSEYEEYIELWIHEIKTPIASAKLIAENHRTPEVRSIDEEIDKIDAFIEQVLFYSRSQLAEKDYIIKALPLSQIVNKVIRKHSKTFITLPITLNLDLPEDCTIYSDSKWIEFILSQILSNAIKYLDKPNKVITFFAVQKKHAVELSIQDNGIGIPETDLLRVFDKGFTGENGRLYGKSTGMGLYLCHKLSLKLGLDLTLTSTPHIGTTVTLSFPKSKMHLLES